MADTSNIPPAVQAQIDEAEYFIFVTQIFFCCMYSVVVWDWVTSLRREYKYVWRSKWTATKCSYLFCRYWVLVVVPFILFVFVTKHTQEECNRIFKVPVALATWNQAGAEVVLLIRTYAFFNRSTNLLILLSMGLGGVVSYQLYVIIAQMDPLPFISANTGPCLPQSKPHSAHILGFFMASLAFDTIATALTLWRSFQMRRAYGPNNSPLIQTFIREGVFYFVLISIANLVNGVFYLQPRQAMSAINIPLSIMFADVLACRMILDLRERGYEISQPTTATPSIPIQAYSDRAGGRNGHLEFGNISESDATRDTESSSTYNSNDPNSPKKSPSSARMPSLPFPSSRNGRGAGRGIRDGRFTPGSVLTTTIGSSIFAHSQNSQYSVPPVDLSSRGTVGTDVIRIDTSGINAGGAQVLDGGNSVELKSFSSRYGSYDEHEYDRDRQEKLSPIGEESPISPGFRVPLSEHRTQTIQPPVDNESEGRVKVDADLEKAL